MDNGGITLAADSIIDELEEAPEVHNLTEGQAKKIIALGEDKLNAALSNNVTDAFWEAYDSVRRGAIEDLSSEI